MTTDISEELLRAIQGDVTALRVDSTPREPRLDKVEKDISGLMTILVGLAGTLRQLTERVRRLETKSMIIVGTGHRPDNQPLNTRREREVTTEDQA